MKARAVTNEQGRTTNGYDYSNQNTPSLSALISAQKHETSKAPPIKQKLLRMLHLNSASNYRTYYMLQDDYNLLDNELVLFERYPHLKKFITKDITVYVSGLTYKVIKHKTPKDLSELML